MVSSTTLLLHIVGGMTLLVVTLSAIYSSAKMQQINTTSFFRFLLFGTLFQIFSGSSLLITTEVSAVTLCSRLGAYLAFIGMASVYVSKKQRTLKSFQQ